MNEDEENIEAEIIEEEVEDERVEPDAMSIDDLLGLTEEDFAEFVEDANHTGMTPLHELLQHLPEESRMHMANLRSSYTKKTQELAQSRKDLANEKEAFRQQQELAISNPVLKQISNSITDDEYDLDTPQGQQKEIERQVAIKLKAILEPAKIEVENRRREFEQEQKMVRLQSFVDSNPDAKTDAFRLPIAKLLMERPNLDLQDAYFIVKGKIESETKHKQATQKQARRSQRRESFNRTSSGTPSRPKGTPVFSSDWEAFKFAKANQGKK